MDLQKTRRENLCGGKARGFSKPPGIPNGKTLLQQVMLSTFAPVRSYPLRTCACPSIVENCEKDSWGHRREGKGNGTEPRVFRRRKNKLSSTKARQNEDGGWTEFGRKKKTTTKRALRRSISFCGGSEQTVLIVLNGIIFRRGRIF